jgi:hypothetical protein
MRYIYFLAPLILFVLSSCAKKELWLVENSLPRQSYCAVEVARGVKLDALNDRPVRFKKRILIEPGQYSFKVKESLKFGTVIIPLRLKASVEGGQTYLIYRDEKKLYFAEITSNRAPEK